MLRMRTKQRKALAEHLQKVKDRWAHEEYDTNEDGDHFPYTSIDYEELVREIDEFSASFQEINGGD